METDADEGTVRARGQQLSVLNSIPAMARPWQVDELRPDSDVHLCTITPSAVVVCTCTFTVSWVM
jgi:hypothetical protein